MSMNATPEERFERGYEADANSGCWLWSGVILTNGYGQIRIHDKKWLAHRLSWTLNRGPVPDGKLVLHKCDVRACVNPDHLFVGDHRDNFNDCIRKGRHKNKGGDTATYRKISSDDVKRILARLGDGETQAVIAADYGISRQAVGAIKRGTSWPTVTGIRYTPRAAERVR